VVLLQLVGKENFVEGLEDILVVLVEDILAVLVEDILVVLEEDILVVLEEDILAEEDNQVEFVEDILVVVDYKAVDMEIVLLLLEVHRDWKLGDKLLDIEIGDNLVEVELQRVLQLQDEQLHPEN